MSAESFEKVGDFKIGVPKTLNSRRLRGVRKKILGGNLAIYFLLSMQKKIFEKIQNPSSYSQKIGGNENGTAASR